MLFERLRSEDCQPARPPKNDEGRKWLEFDPANRSLIPVDRKPSGDLKQMMKLLKRELAPECDQSSSKETLAQPRSSTPATQAKSPEKRKASPSRVDSRKKAKIKQDITDLESEPQRQKSTAPGRSDSSRPSRTTTFRSDQHITPATEIGPTKQAGRPSTRASASSPRNPDGRAIQTVTPQRDPCVSGSTCGSSKTVISPTSSVVKVMCDQGVQTDAVYIVNITGTYMVNEAQLFDLAARNGWIPPNPYLVGTGNLIDIHPEELAAATTAVSGRRPHPSQLLNNLASAHPVSAAPHQPTPASALVACATDPAIPPAPVILAATPNASVPTSSTPTFATCTNTAHAANASIEGSVSAGLSSTHSSASSSPHSPFLSNATGQLDTLWDGAAESSETPTAQKLTFHGDFSC
ncbi:hypothetical protein OC845_005162 [Tilletia horrida]|nr:hypothetical protein OC845_005162 [Tilletia horrida]